MHFLKWVVSTAAIFSGCDFKKPVKQEELKIGVSYDLMSFDPFSFQSLGERDVIDLIYSRLLEIDGGKIQSDYLSNIRLNERSIKFDKMDDETFAKAKAVFFKGKHSVLWKSVFDKFALSRSSIIYKGENDYLAQVLTLWPLLVMEEKGFYKVSEHKKGRYVSLESNDSKLIEKLKIIRVKDHQTALDMILKKDLDYYFPSKAFSKDFLKPYKDIEVVKSKDRATKLRLYYKFGKNTQMNSIFCSNQKDFQKLLDSDWVLEKDQCGKVINEKVSKVDSLKLLYSNRSLMKFADFFSNLLKTQTGIDLEYELKSSLDLTKSLKMGQFDLHLSLESEKLDQFVLKDSFHTDGVYNTYKVSDKALDKSLEKSSKTMNFKEFESINAFSRKRLDEVLPLVFSYTKPAVKYIKLKSSKKHSSKSLKTFIFLK